jgi:hypothetical protein
LLPDPAQRLDTSRLRFWKPTFSTPGFSFFGYRMLWLINFPVDGLTAHDRSAIQREQVSEEVRETRFPELLSRFQSLFCFQTVEQATDYKVRSGHPEWSVWRVRGDNPFVGDMNLYNTAAAEEFPELAGRYWSGEMTAWPIPEVLLKLPVSLIEPVPGDASHANQVQPER